MRKGTQVGVYLALLLGVSLLASGFIANSIIPLVSTPVQVTVTVKDSSTMQPIQGASVNCYLSLSGMLADSGSTNQYGVVSLWGYFETPLNFEASSTGYSTKSISTTIYSTGSKALTILLVSNGKPGGEGYIDIYCLSNDDRRVNNVLISTSFGNVLTDDHGYARIHISSGSNVISFSSSYGPKVKSSLSWESLSFTDYSRTVTPVSETGWVAYVQQASLTLGNPADEKGDLWTWLFESDIAGVPNWALVIGVMFIFLMLKR